MEAVERLLQLADDQINGGQEIFLVLKVGFESKNLPQGTVEHKSRINYRQYTQKLRDDMAVVMSEMMRSKSDKELIATLAEAILQLRTQKQVWRQGS